MAQCGACPFALVIEEGVPVFEEGRRETAIRTAQIHSRYRHCGDARRCAGEAGRTDTEAEAARACPAEDGQARCRLSETLRSLLPPSDQARAHSLWRGVL